MNFTDQQLIFEQGSQGNSFYLIAEGHVKIIKDGVVLRTIAKLDYFGERSILFNEARSATTISQGETVCWTMSQSEFMAVIDQNIVQHLKVRIAYQDEKALLNDLIPVKVLGQGMFGTVILVYSRHKGNLYALKAISKSKISRYRLYENTMMEKRVLSQIDHMLIMKLIRTYHDEFFIYLLCEFVNGMDLFDVLRKMENVNDAQAKFFIANLLLILEHMHERSIVYRDLKPENVMVDEYGYLKMIDYGTAKILQGRTFTIVGTPHYMAPEIILNNGYSFAADYWSLGAMLYEFVVGRVPFGEDQEDPYVVYQMILKSDLTFPTYVMQTLPSIIMIEQLLSKDPSKRSNIEAIKANPWIADFDWVKTMQEGLLNRNHQAPYCPTPIRYEEDIEKAMKNRISVEAFLCVNPTQRMDSSAKPRKSRETGPPGWDMEF